VEEIETLSETERLLLMAAAVRGRGPRSDIMHANTAKIVSQVLHWLGLSDEEIRRGWWESEAGERSVECAKHLAVYEVLIRMTQPLGRRGRWRPAERPGRPLFEGAGNWGVPGKHPACSPLFNACRLTRRGERIARVLLARHPEYRETAEK
jgi:hypothetical protein